MPGLVLIQIFVHVVLFSDTLMGLVRSLGKGIVGSQISAGSEQAFRSETINNALVSTIQRFFRDIVNEFVNAGDGQAQVRGCYYLCDMDGVSYSYLRDICIWGWWRQVPYLGIVLKVVATHLVIWHGEYA